MNRNNSKLQIKAREHAERVIAKQESIADFKHRIALLMRNKEGGKQYSIIGAARPDPSLVRCHGKDGRLTTCPRGGAALQQWQRDNR